MTPRSVQQIEKAMDKVVDKAEAEAKVIKAKDDSSGKNEAHHKDMKEPDHYKTRPVENR